MRIYLADLPGEVDPPSRRRVISSLQILFNNVTFFGFLGPALVKAGAKKIGPDLPKSVLAGLKGGPWLTPLMITWTDHEPKLAKHDLLVYFVEDRNDSVVWTINNKKASIDASGLTHFTPALVGSEVYLHPPNQDHKVALEHQMALLAFHECMHNVTGWAGETLHSMHLYKNQRTCLTGGDLSEFWTMSFPCPGDNLIMADHLFSPAPPKGTRRSQWTGGFALYKNQFRKRP
jgi:hypothetical protein